MCGIAGIINTQKPIEGDEKREMNILLHVMRYRGRDASKTQQIGQRILFGANRMRITDYQNPDADMPLSDAFGRYTIVFNGEIYNHKDIRRQCPTFPFKTQCDTETILAAYDQWGDACIDHLEGMYAFCLYDKEKDRFLMAVGPARQKPFFFLQDKNSFVFCSDMDSLVADPYRTKTWDRIGIAQIVTARFAVGDQTQFKEIKKLKPGHKIIIERDRSVKISQHYFIPVGDQNRLDIPAVREEIFHAAEEACNQTFNVELPSAALLSGGVDSSAVTAFAANRFDHLKTFSIGFAKDTRSFPSNHVVFNEFEYSDLVAETYKTDHRKLLLQPNEFCAYLEKFLSLSSEPVSALEAPCFLKQFELIANEGVRIVFMGNGPDEVFDGYRYGQRLIGHNIQELPDLYVQHYGWNHKVSMSDLMPELHQHAHDKISQTIKDYMNPYLEQITDIEQMTQIVNLSVYCGDCDNPYIDRTSMEHNIEVRNPYFNRKLIQAAFAFHPNLKTKNDVEKWIFKETFRGFLPDQIVNRKKVGFTAPANFKFSKDFETMMETIFEKDSPLLHLEIVNLKYMDEIWKMRDDSYRNTFYRLLSIDGILRRQENLKSVYQNKYDEINNKSLSYEH